MPPQGIRSHACRTSSCDTCDIPLPLMKPKPEDGREAPTRTVTSDRFDAAHHSEKKSPESGASEPAGWKPTSHHMLQIGMGCACRRVEVDSDLLYSGGCSSGRIQK